MKKKREINGLKDSEIRDLLSEIENLKKENLELKNRLKENSTQFFSEESRPAVNKIFLDNHFHAFFNQVPFLMWTKDVDGRYIAANSVFGETLDKNPEELIGLRDDDLFSKFYADKYREQDLEIINTGKQISHEDQIPLAVGSVWYEVIKAPLINDDGVVFGLAGFARDISERKVYEEAIKSSEQKFRELAENISDSFILHGGNDILYVNPAFEKVYGYNRSEILENSDIYKSWIHPDDIVRISKVLESEEYKSNYIFNEQYRTIKKNGKVSWIWNRNYPVGNSGGDTPMIVSVASNITEIKKLEGDLRKQQYEQQAILDNIPHLAWLKNNEGVYVSVNQSFCKYFDLKAEEVIGKTDFDIVSKELALSYIAKDKDVLLSGEQRLFNEVSKGKFGENYSETHKTPVINDQNEVIGVAGISRDITEQKLAEKALVQSEEKYKDLITLLPEVVFETDAKGIITFVNLRGFEISGFTLADLTEVYSIFNLIASEEKGKAVKLFEEAEKGTEFRDVEFTLITKSQDKIPVLIYTNNLYQDGKWSGVRAVMVDNSTRKEAERHEALHQKKLLALSESALDFLSMPTSEDLFDYIGSKFKSLLGDTDILITKFDEKSVVLKLVYFSWDDESKKKVKELLKLSSEDYEFGVGTEALEVLKNRDGMIREISGGFSEGSFDAVPKDLSDEMQKVLGVKRFYGLTLCRSGNLYGTLLLLSKSDKIHDMHLIEAFVYQASIALHRRHLEQELVSAKLLAEESDKLKTGFLANMSHEIRTPMNGILGLTQLLSAKDLEEDRKKEYISMIKSNGNILMELVNDIIDISKIESKQVDLFENEISLNDMMSDLSCLISGDKLVNETKKVEFVFKPSFKDHEDIILGDQAKIRQILTNLISNAIKFTEKGKIEFGYRLDKNKDLLFYVQDTGIGIQNEKKEVIFERFIQVDQSLTRQYSGSGLGLAISKGFVDRMGGKIWVESEYQEGSCFYFSIPYKKIEKRKTISIDKQFKIDQFEWSNLTILIVEDNLISFTLLEISLRKTGCSIIHADNGKSAVDMVKENPEINLVLMDIQLPIMNGYEATREIKKLRPDLPVIALTANALDDDRMKCINAGCSDYITKPILLNKILPTIETYLQ